MPASGCLVWSIQLLEVIEGHTGWVDTSSISKLLHGADVTSSLPSNHVIESTRMVLVLEMLCNLQVVSERQSVRWHQLCTKISIWETICQRRSLTIPLWIGYSNYNTIEWEVIWGSLVSIWHTTCNNSVLVYVKLQGRCQCKLYSGIYIYRYRETICNVKYMQSKSQKQFVVAAIFILTKVQKTVHIVHTLLTTTNRITEWCWWSNLQLLLVIVHVTRQ